MKLSSFFNRLKWIGVAFLVIFSFLFLGGLHVGALSVRMIVAYGLFVFALLFGSNNYEPTRGMKMYYVYILVYILVNILGYTAFSGVFIKDLIAVHFVCCIIIFAFPRIFKTEASIWGAYIVIVIGFIFNAIVTILQSQNAPLGWAIGMFINPTEIDELEIMQAKIADIGELKKSVVIGIMGRSTANGYFIATILPVITYYLWDRLKFKSLWSFVLIVIAVICVYFIQQRMALIVVATYIICVILFKKTPWLLKITMISIILFSIIYYWDSIMSFDYTQAGRLFYAHDERRTNTIVVLKDFLNDPIQLLVGNNRVIDEQEYEIFLIIGHNTFTDTIRMGGLFLFIPYLILFYCLCKTLIDIFIFSRKVNDYRTMGMAMGCLCFLLYSQTHSTGVQSGSIMFWTLYMLCVQSYRLRRQLIDYHL